jgi:hypothetical protein
MGPCQPYDLISVFSVKHMIDATRARWAETSATAQTPTDTVGAADPDKAQNAGDDDIVA